MQLGKQTQTHVYSMPFDQILCLNLVFLFVQITTYSAFTLNPQLFNALAAGRMIDNVNQHAMRNEKFACDTREEGRCQIQKDFQIRSDGKGVRDKE